MEGNLSDVSGSPLYLVGLAVLMIGFIVFVFEAFASVDAAASGASDPIGVFCGFGLACIGGGILAFSRWSASPADIPPPPPIQQPMVPAGTQGPVGLNCPACGAPAQDVDRFGVAVCTHCGTRFLVR